MPLTKRSKINPPSQLELCKISKAEVKPAILKIVEPYAEALIPRFSSSLLPHPMMELYMPDMLHKSYLPLLEKCKEKFKAIQV